MAEVARDSHFWMRFDEQFPEDGGPVRLCERCGMPHPMELTLTKRSRPRRLCGYCVGWFLAKRRARRAAAEFRASLRQGDDGATDVPTLPPT